GGYANARTAARRVLEIDRADPLAARFDHVLGTVGEAQEAEAVDRPDVAGVEPAVAVCGGKVGVIAIHDPRAADLQLARLFAVPCQRRAFIVDDAQLDAELHPALPRQDRLGREILAFGHQQR